MSVLSLTAKHALLNATIGTARASAIPATFYLVCFDGDPSTTGVELTTAGGYTRISVAWTDAMWLAASGGFKGNAVAIQSAISTGAWSATATHVGFADAASAGNIWDYGVLDTPVAITTANQLMYFAVNSLKIGIA